MLEILGNPSCVGYYCTLIRVCFLEKTAVSRLAHLQCEGLLFWSSRLLSVPRQILKTKQVRRKISSPLQEMGVAEQEYDIIFCTGSS